MATNQPIGTAAGLIPGQSYRVKTAFKDFDGILHPVGETWRFESKAFLPHDDGLTLIVVQDGLQRPIRLQWTPEAQGQIIQDFGQYVAALPAVGAPPPPKTHKSSAPPIIFSVIGVVGLIALCLCAVVGGAAWWMADKMTYRALGNGLDFDNIAVDLKAKGIVTLDQDFSFTITIRNEGSQPRTLHSIELQNAYLKEVTILGSEPPFGKQSSDQRAILYTRFDFQQPIPPSGGSLVVRFDVKALKLGDISHDVLVCIDTANNCAVYYNPVIVNR